MTRSKAVSVVAVSVAVIGVGCGGSTTIDKGRQIDLGTGGSPPSIASGDASVSVGGVSMIATGGMSSDASTAAGGAPGFGAGGVTSDARASSGGALDARVAADADAPQVEAGPCPLSNPPACLPGDECAPDWATALARFPACQLGKPGSSLGRCGPYDVVVFTGFDNGAVFLYDDAGRLAGEQNAYSCSAYDPKFVPLDQSAFGWCVPLPQCVVDGGHADAH